MDGAEEEVREEVSRRVAGPGLVLILVDWLVVILSQTDRVRDLHAVSLRFSTLVVLLNLVICLTRIVMNVFSSVRRLPDVCCEQLA